MCMKSDGKPLKILEITCPSKILCLMSSSFFAMASIFEISFPMESPIWYLYSKKCSVMAEYCSCIVVSLSYISFVLSHVISIFSWSMSNAKLINILDKLLLFF